MNYLAIVKKHMELAEVAYGNIVKPETRAKAYEVVGKSLGRMGWVAPVSEAGVGSVSDSLRSGGVSGEVGVMGAPEEQKPAELKETAPVEIFNGNPVLTPVSDHEWEGGGETVTQAAPSVVIPVEMIGGWPTQSDMTVIGLAPNRRHIKATLPDGRVVTVERSMGRKWVNGETVRCRIIRAGAAPLFRILPEAR